MNSEQCTFSLEPGGGSMPTLSSGISQSLPSSGTPTLAPFSEAEQPMDGSLVCTCGREMSGCSTHPSTLEKWIASQRDSLAQIFQQPVEARESTVNAPDFTGKSYESPILYDLDSCSWRTPQLSLVEDLDKSLVNWPSAGIMRDGRCYPLARLVTTMNDLDGGASQKEIFLTPKCHETGEGSETYVKRTGDRTANCFNSLFSQLKAFPFPRMDGHRKKGVQAERSNFYPTPTTQSNAQIKGQYKNPKSGTTLAGHIGGKPNPKFVAWLMGWPLSATSLNALEMDKFQSARRQRGKSSRNTKNKRK